MGQLRIWAGNEVYGSGHGAFTGQTNKTDPGATIAGDGLVPGEEMDAVHLNHQLHEHSIGAIQARLASLRTYETVLGSFTSAIQNFGAAFVDHLGLAGFCFGGEFWTIGDTPYALNPGASNVDSVCQTLLYDKVTERLVMLGSGTSNGAYSDNDGVTWVDATTEPGNPITAGLWMAEDLMISHGTGTSVWVSQDGGDNWASNTAISGESIISIAKCGPLKTDVLLLGTAGTIRSASPDDAYSSWTDRGTIPDPSPAPTTGNLVHNTDGVAYFVGTYADGVRIYSKNSVSSAWQQITLIDISGLDALSGSPFLKIDDPTNVIYLMLRHSSTRTTTFASVDGGETWVGPGTLVGQISIGVFAAAAGRLWQRAEDTVVVRSAVPWSV